jgi:hypothetical protein
MLGYQNSYWKTLLLAGISGVAAIVGVYWLPIAPGIVKTLLVVAAWLAALPLMGVALGGCVVLYRDSLQRRGQRDLFHALIEHRAEEALASDLLDFGLATRRFFRGLLGLQGLLVGDRVLVRPFDEIRATLDEADSLDGLPFLPEMLRYCGREGVVFRRVDKIYDYGGRKDLRRLKHCVLLGTLRCDGSAHGNCEAACYLLWNEKWLKRAADASVPGISSAEPQQGATPAFTPQSRREADGAVRYTCQYTQLVKASTPMWSWDARQDLRPLIAGNVTLTGFLVVLLTRLFNHAQGIRGGVRFPFVPESGGSQTPAVRTDLLPGDTVRVLGAEAIGRTLDKNGRNRGLWFDRDMVKHCGRTYQVLTRVDRIIDDATGKMRLMKTPCIVLKNVQYSGEYLRFGAQQDQFFWREAWLSPKLSTDSGADAPARPVAGESS